MSQYFYVHAGRASALFGAAGVCHNPAAEYADGMPEGVYALDENGAIVPLATEAEAIADVREKYGE
jgi:hypothetical protein